MIILLRDLLDLFLSKFASKIRTELQLIMSNNYVFIYLFISWASFAWAYYFHQFNMDIALAIPLLNERKIQNERKTLTVHMSG